MAKDRKNKEDVIISWKDSKSRKKGKRFCNRLKLFFLMKRLKSELGAKISLFKNNTRNIQSIFRRSREIHLYQIIELEEIWDKLCFGSILRTKFQLQNMHKHYKLSNERIFVYLLFPFITLIGNPQLQRQSNKPEKILRPKSCFRQKFQMTA